MTLQQEITFSCRIMNDLALYIGFNSIPLNTPMFQLYKFQLHPARFPHRAGIFCILG